MTGTDYIDVDSYDFDTNSINYYDARSEPAYHYSFDDHLFRRYVLRG
ncbi:MAG: hypothetical protein MZU84_06605 [Sphingobacterium sp.]|nr:hypothetical protein [Sphingobacterium sp.]